MTSKYAAEGESSGRPLQKTSDGTTDPSKLTALTQGILEQVLHETESISNQPAAEESADLTALCNIARKYPNSQLVLDPILIELVEVMLTRQFKSENAIADWKIIARRVADGLFEDPGSHRRLHEFWNRLLKKSK